MENVRKLQKRRGQPVPASLTELMSGAAQHVGILPQLDVYRTVRRRPAAGPLEDLPDAISPPSDQRPALFFYLAADYKHTRKTLEVVAQSGIGAEGFVRGPTARMVRELTEQGIVIHDSPVPLETALRRTTAVLHHGGIGTSEKVLSLGRPQLLLPRHLEQELNALALKEQGVGVVLMRNQTVDSARQTIRQVCTNKGLANTTAKLAGAVDRRGTMKDLMGLCEAVAKRHCTGN